MLVNRESAAFRLTSAWREVVVVVDLGEEEGEDDGGSGGTILVVEEDCDDSDVGVSMMFGLSGVSFLPLGG